MKPYEIEHQKIQSLITFIGDYISPNNESKKQITTFYQKRFLSMIVLYLTANLLEKGIENDIKQEEISTIEGIEKYVKDTNKLTDDDYLEVVKTAGSEFSKALVTDLRDTLPNLNFQAFYNKLIENGYIRE